MNLSTPLILVILAGASYARRDDAVEAFNIARGARRQGGSGYMDVAVLTKDAAGELQAERHDSTARHYARGGAPLGDALVIVAPAGIAAVAAGDAALAGAGGTAGHFWHMPPRPGSGYVARSALGQTQAG